MTLVMYSMIGIVFVAVMVIVDWYQSGLANMIFSIGGGWFKIGVVLLILCSLWPVFIIIWIVVFIWEVVRV